MFSGCEAVVRQTTRNNDAFPVSELENVSQLQYNTRSSTSTVWLHFDIKITHHTFKPSFDLKSYQKYCPFHSTTQHPRKTFSVHLPRPCVSYDIRKNPLDISPHHSIACQNGFFTSSTPPVSATTSARTPWTFFKSSTSRVACTL